MSDHKDQAILTSRAAQAFFDSHTIACAIIANDLRFADASDRFVEHFGSEVESVKGCLLTDLLFEFVGAEGELQKILAGKESQYFLENVNRLSTENEPRYFDFTIQPLWPQQPAEGLLLLVEDVTPFAQIQQQLVQERNELRLVRQKLDQANKELVQLNEMKSFFLSMAAHDLRAPLTSMYGYSDLLLEMPDVPEAMQKRGLITIRRQAERMHRLIDDLLSLDQVEQNQLTIIPQAFALNEGVEEVARSLDPMLAGENLTLKLTLPQPSLTLWVDPGKIMQILYNLMHNAAKYTPKGGQIKINAYTEGRDAVIEVQNSDAALTEEQLAMLFTLYYRTESAKSSKRSGSGLGLFIVKMLVEAQDGKIDVRSEAGVGTTFTVHLPLAKDGIV